MSRWQGPREGSLEQRKAARLSKLAELQTLAKLKAREKSDALAANPVVESVAKPVVEK